MNKITRNAITANRVNRRLFLGLTAGSAATLGLTACGGSGFSSNTAGSGGGSGSTGPSASASSTSGPAPTKDALTVLIASSGTAETNAVKKAVGAWSQQSGIKATVIPASNLEQQAAQGFASGKPADLLYTSTNDFYNWARTGNLYAYGDLLSNKSDYYPKLVQAFTYNNTFYCAPKDFSTLQLVVNTDMWKQAGLTTADHPKTWDELHAVSKKLSKGKVAGLTMSPQVERIGVFMAEAGGGMTAADGKTATVDSQPNIKALDFLKTMLADGSLKWSSQLSAGWGGEAFGKGSAAMTVEGNWITGAMQSSYQNVKYKIIALPKGTQQGTLEYTNGWGITAKSHNIGGALSLVKFLTTTKQQLEFSKEFGVMPSLQTAKSQWEQQNPDLVPFIEGAAYAQNLPVGKGVAQVLSDFDSKIPQLSKTDSKKLLTTIQTELQAALQG